MMWRLLRAPEDTRRMRLLAGVLAVVFCVGPAFGQRVPVVPLQELNAAMSGAWTGVLEYRDYSEPATSSKRVKLPTWLRIEVAGGSLQFHYIYDDGPGKTVSSTEVVTVDGARATWTTVAEATKDKPGEKPRVEVIGGLDKLRDGRGVLALTGPGLENGQPVELRTTVRVGRNLLEMLRESRVPGGEFSFRDSYTLVRAEPPAAK